MSDDEIQMIDEHMSAKAQNHHLRDTQVTTPTTLFSPRSEWQSLRKQVTSAGEEADKRKSLFHAGDNVK